MSKRQRHTPEQVISKLREAEVKLAKGTAIAQVCKDLAIAAANANARAGLQTRANPGVVE